MGIRARLSFSFTVSLFLNFWFIFKILRIYYYATASTDSAAYIIGGYKYGYGKVSTIAQFKNNQWLKIGDVNKKKSFLSAISHDGEYLIVGGFVDFGRLVNLFNTIIKHCNRQLQRLTSNTASRWSRDGNLPLLSQLKTAIHMQKLQHRRFQWDWSRLSPRGVVLLVALHFWKFS